MLPVTKTEIAKMAVQMAVAAKVTQITEQQVAQHSNLDTDGIPVKVGSTIVGMLVAQQLKPVTDSVVDSVIERYQTWKTKKSSTN